MKKFMLVVLCSLSIFMGCVKETVPVRHDVAISNDSARIAYNVYGTGSTSLILIHGWSCDSRYWCEQVPYFSKKYQVITIDLAGHGHSGIERNKYSMKSFGEDVVAVLKDSNSEKAILIGHSMGGGVILHAAKIASDRVIGLIGVDTLHNFEERINQKQIEEFVEPFKKNFKKSVDKFVRARFVKGTDEILVNWIAKDRIYFV